MRITTSNALLALSAAAISAASVDAFVPPVPQMVAPGRGAKDLTASKPRVSRPLASRLDMQVSPDKRAKDAKGRGGAAAPLGAVAMPASGRVPVAPRVVTSDAAVLADSLLKAALHSSVIVALIGAAQFLSVRFSPVGTTQAMSEAGRWALWAGTVFASGAIAAGPKKWLESSDLIKVLNVDVAASKEWYDNLRKPWFNPPKWAFPVMWIPLKVLQVCACYEMWSQLKVRTFLAAPVVMYAVYKSLGDAWNKIFFESRRLKMANVIMSLYLTSLLMSVKLFFDVSTKAGLLFAPTVAWITVATCLQWSTWALNRDDPHA